jgi:hypothetical protein
MSFHREEPPLYASGSPDLLTDWREIRKEQFDALSDTWYKSSLLSVISELACSQLLSGGIVFEIDGKRIDDEDQHELTIAWTRFVKELVRDIKLYGLCVWTIVHHDKHNGIPRVVPFHGIRVFMSQDIWGNRFYKAYRRFPKPTKNMVDLMPMQLNVEGNDTPLTGIFFSEEHGYAPDSFGNLRSKLMSVMEDVRTLSRLENLKMIALARMALPDLVVEEQKKDYDPASLTFAMGTHVGDPSSALRQKSVSPEEAMRQHAALMKALAANTGSVDSAASAIRAQDSRVIELDAGKILKSQLPSTTTEDWARFSLILEERLCAMFGLPLSQWKATQSNKGTSENKQQKETFDTSQRNLKQLVTPILRTAFNLIHSEFIAAKQLWYNSNDNFGNVKRTVTARVVLPGVPNFDILLKLYAELGCLTYESFRQYSGALFCIPSQDFYDTPVLSPAEYSGVDLTPPDTLSSDSVFQKRVNTNTKNKQPPVTLRKPVPKKTRRKT